MSQRLLVTGGAGYVGSHCCKAFAEAGWDIVVLDDLSRGWSEFVKWGELVQGDIRDQLTVNKVFADLMPTAVAHFAAMAYVGESNHKPAEYYRTNVGGTINVLDAMRRYGTRNIVFSSTCATYGIPSSIPIPESQPQDPINPYGRSKMMAEAVIRDFGKAYGIRSVILRYFNAAGADLNGELGERHQPETHAIPLLLEAACGDGQPFTIFGSNYPTPDGTAVRDYIHVTDLASAHLKALSHLMDGGNGGSFNLGTGNGVSVLQLIEEVERCTGREVAYRFGDPREGDPAELVADASEAYRSLGWRPAHSSIHQIVKDAWQWYRLESTKRQI